MLSADDQLKAVKDALDKAAAAKTAKAAAQAANLALKDVARSINPESKSTFSQSTTTTSNPISSPTSKSRYQGSGDLIVAGDVYSIPHPLERIQLTTDQIRAIAQSGDVKSTTVAEASSNLPTGDLKKKQSNLGDAGKLSLKGSALSANVYAEHIKARETSSTPRKGGEIEDDRYLPAATTPVAETPKGTKVVNSLKKGKSLRQLAMNAKGILSNLEHSLSNMFNQDKEEHH